ncbi:uncharacterized protein PITG_21419 [Phytophthora infestans T30-4]|nr:uncharacterized protein PITG_21419 [Phytophthora infestans T30-4]EEY64411.1 conserved hypothetical protein [Phytophthora infestans T30-4]|eukprot:XP_002894874.1 conserved hypothetical protein [Phytophthora infestans T30-4]
MLQRALKSANQGIQRYHPNAGVFAVLVDTNPKISQPKASSGRISVPPDDSDAQFPSFVLGHTMDVYWKDVVKMNKTSAYKDAVCIGDKNEAWKYLVSMGRPLWKSTFDASMKKYNSEVKAAERVLRLAAQRMLLGRDTLSLICYDETTMFGVASMLCRLGLRPHSSSSLAPRVVADLMAILAYLNYESDGCLSSFSSDPVLALGATKVWYNCKPALANCILPQLKKLLLNEMLDTCGVDEITPAKR